IGQMIVEAGLGGAGPLAEAQHHALLVRLDLVDPAREPQEKDHPQHRCGAGATESARKEAAHAILRLAEQLLEIGRLAGAGRAASPAPGAAAASAAPRAATLILP